MTRRDIVVLGLVLVAAATSDLIFMAVSARAVQDITERVPEYRADDPIFKYVPPAPEKWTQAYGDNERARILYAISEMRVRQAALATKVTELDATLNPAEPNEPNEVKP